MLLQNFTGALVFGILDIIGSVAVFVRSFVVEVRKFHDFHEQSFDIGRSILYIGRPFVLSVIFAALLLYGLRSKRSDYVLAYIVWNVSFYQYFINIQSTGLSTMVQCPVAGYIQYITIGRIHTVYPSTALDVVQ